MVTLHTYRTGFTLRTRTTRIEYWRPRSWVPLSFRPHRRRWGTLVRTPVREPS